MPGKAIMFQGTSSHCGKTIIAAAVCRMLRRVGVKVAPFKAQNMSLNSYVTANGGEIARAQALQALAAGIEPTVDMNPILIKPKGHMMSQIVLQGKPYCDISAADYYENFALQEGLRAVEESLERLKMSFDIIVMEGAGSPVEINLYQRDIANMRIAELTDASVFIVGDIERGGVFASLVGTWHLLMEEHKPCVKGFIINKFRGDMELLTRGINQLEALVKIPIITVVPFLPELQLPLEDSVGLEGTPPSHPALPDVAIVRFPHISNFTDFDALWLDGRFNIRYVSERSPLGKPGMIILPGTKNTIKDLEWLRTLGLADAICSLRKEGTVIMGICGGFQMLGNRIEDPKGIEGGFPNHVQGLGLLDVSTVFDAYSKTTVRVEARIRSQPGLFATGVGKTIHGYMIHMGRSTRGFNVTPTFEIVEGSPTMVGLGDGAVSSDGRVVGTYIHGLLDEASSRQAIVDYLAMSCRSMPRRRMEGNIEDVWQLNLDRLADCVEQFLPLERLLAYADVQVNHA